ncbi:MAG: 50S ribosomal protein L21e [Thermoplasmata archaeon]
MVKASKGFRSRSRGWSTKHAREKGMPPITRYLREFAIGDRVTLRLESSDVHGMPHPRYQGRTCTVVKKSGRAYIIEFVDGGKVKQLVANPVHLWPVKETPRADA